MELSAPHWQRQLIGLFLRGGRIKTSWTTLEKSKPSCLRVGKCKAEEHTAKHTPERSRPTARVQLTAGAAHSWSGAVRSQWTRWMFGGRVWRERKLLSDTWTFDYSSREPHDLDQHILYKEHFFLKTKHSSPHWRDVWIRGGKVQQVSYWGWREEYSPSALSFTSPKQLNFSQNRKKPWQFLHSWNKTVHLEIYFFPFILSSLCLCYCFSWDFSSW